MRPSYNYKLKNNLKAIRIARKLSQSKVAMRVGIKLDNYRKIENGKSIPSTTTTLVLAMVLNERPERLFYLEKVI